MKNMLDKIVKMDESARKKTEKARLERNLSKEEIEKTRQDIFNKYLDTARKRVKAIEDQERLTAEKEWMTVKAQHDEALNNLNREYKQKGAKWVDDIVKNVLSDF